MRFLSYILPLFSGLISPDWTVIENVRYGSYERNLADLYLLNDNKQHPTVIFVHGGGWAAGDKDFYRSRARKYSLAGFNVVSITYTLANENPKTHWPAAERDVRIAVQWVKSNCLIYGFDPDKLVVGGDSAGGHLSLFMGLESGVKVVQDMYGPSDLTQPSMAKIMEGLDVFGKQTYEQNPQLYIDATPILQITKSYPPTFIAHSADDKVIPYSQSQLLYDWLRAVKVPSQFITYHGHDEPYGGHNIYGLPFYVYFWVEMRALWFTLRYL